MRYHLYPIVVTIIVGERMAFARRRFLHLAAVAVALPAASRIARAEKYPSRPVRIVVGFPPGAARDISARIMAQWLSERLKQTVLVENRTGANGNAGGAAVASAPPMVTRSCWSARHMRSVPAITPISVIVLRAIWSG